VGRRTTASPFDTFRSELFAVSTYITFAWYITSALLFAEVYVWARPHDAGFGMINHGRAHERARLNERAVAFRTLFVLLGVVQSLIHLFSDRDRVPSPTRKVKVDAKAVATLTTTDAPLVLVKRTVPGLVFRLVWTATVFPVAAIILYVFTPLRNIAWSIAFDTLRFIYFLPPKQRNSYTGFAPFLPFFIATVMQTILLVLLWEGTNAAFSAYIAQPPLRREQPLTSDAQAKDPNGSLINGLKSKKDFARSSAFHELILITTSFTERRKTIYAELDRVGGNTWSQISTLCLEQIKGVTTRIDALNPAPPPPPTETQERKHIAPPLKTDNPFATTPLPMGTPARTGAWAKKVANDFAKDLGSNPGAEPAKDAISFAGRKLLSAEQRDRIAAQPAEVEKSAKGLWAQLITSPIGWPFRHSFERQVEGVVCGTPYSKAGAIVDAIDSLTKLVVESLKEDIYGKVSGDVVEIIRTYLTTLKAVQKYVKDAKPHWSDITFTETKRSQIKDVNEVIEALGDGLAGMLGAFGEYLTSLGLSSAEIKEVKAVVAEAMARKAQSTEGEGPRRKDRREMEQVR
jgi:nucleoporin NDC1